MNRTLLSVSLTFAFFHLLIGNLKFEIIIEPVLYPIAYYRRKLSKVFNVQKVWPQKKSAK